MNRPSKGRWIQLDIMPKNDGIINDNCFLLDLQGHMKVVVANTSAVTQGWICDCPKNWFIVTDKGLATR